MPSEPNESEPRSFEQSLEALQEIVHDLEDGQVGLAESLAKYEQGVKLLKECYELLQKAERRIELLTRMGPGGEPLTEPFDDSPSAQVSSGVAESNATRSRRRSAKAAPKGPADIQTPNSGDDTRAIDVPRGLF